MLPTLGTAPIMPSTTGDVKDGMPMVSSEMVILVPVEGPAADMYVAYVHSICCEHTHGMLSTHTRDVA